jgi:hypothetical protein
MTIEGFLIGSTAAFFIVFLGWWIEWRLSFVKKLIEIRCDAIRDRMHNEDRTYYEHRKSINTRLGVLEEKVGWLDTIIEEAKLEEQKQELQLKIQMLNSDLEFFKAMKKPVKKKSR